MSIRVNAIVPGYIETQMTEGVFLYQSLLKGSYITDLIYSHSHDSRSKIPGSRPGTLETFWNG